MKVKHWAGYGCVEAECLARSEAIVIIKVKGNHEQGLLPRYFDSRDWDRWLGKRFRVGDFAYVEANEFWSDKEKSDITSVKFWR